MGRSSLSGEFGNLLQITCVTAAALHTYLDTVTTTGTNLKAAEGTLVQLSTGADYEVTVPANDTVPSGVILKAELIGVVYYVTVGIFCCKGASVVAFFKPTAVVEMTYNGTVALGDSVFMNGTANEVDVGGSAGIGYVILKDAANTKVQVLV